MNQSSFTFTIFILIIVVLVPASQAFECYTSYENATSNTKEECGASHDACYLTASFTNSTLDANSIGLGCKNKTSCTNECEMNANTYDCVYCCESALCNGKKVMTKEDIMDFFTTSSAAMNTNGMAITILSLIYLSAALLMN